MRTLVKKSEIFCLHLRNRSRYLKKNFNRFDCSKFLGFTSESIMTQNLTNKITLLKIENTVPF